MHKAESEQAKAKLVEAVSDQIASEPFERGGVKWAAVHQEPLAEHLGISVKTLHRWTDAPPFQRDVAIVGEHGKMTLLRVLAEGEKPVIAPETIANHMRAVWKKMVGAELNGKQHGCLIGLAKDWPEDHQLAIFKHTLANWSSFMAATKLLMYVEADKKGMAIKNGAPLHDGESLPVMKGLSIRYLKFPSITYMRCFANIAVVVYAQSLQFAGKPVPPGVKAIYGQYAI